MDRPFIYREIVAFLLIKSYFKTGMSGMSSDSFDIRKKI